jgi:hypothetical protein
MSLDLELFIRDALEKAIQENPTYATIQERFVIRIDNGQVIVLSLE